MNTDSHLISLEMFKEVITGRSYRAVATQYGVTRTVVERRIKAFGRKLSKEVGIEGLNEESATSVRRLRSCRLAVMEALDRYEPRTPQGRGLQRVLTEEDIRLAVQRTRSRSSCPSRDVALLYVLLTTGARPLEIARLETRDYLNADGSVRQHSEMRADVAVNRKARPLFFASRAAKEAIDTYLAERIKRGFCSSEHAEFRGLDPRSRLFLTDVGVPFEIVTHAARGGAHFLCRGIHATYRKIFRRSGLSGVSALGVRRTVAMRLLERGAAEEQIGEILGISDKKSVKQLLAKQREPLQSIVRELV